MKLVKTQVSGCIMRIVDEMAREKISIIYWNQIWNVRGPVGEIVQLGVRNKVIRDLRRK